MVIRVDGGSGGWSGRGKKSREDEMWSVHAFHSELWTKVVALKNSSLSVYHHLHTTQFFRQIINPVELPSDFVRS